MKQFTLSLDLVESLSFSCSLFLLVHYLPHVIHSRYKFSNLMNKLNRNTQRKKHLLRTHTISLPLSFSLLFEWKKFDLFCIWHETTQRLFDKKKKMQFFHFFLLICFFFFFSYKQPENFVRSSCEIFVLFFSYQKNTFLYFFSHRFQRNILRIKKNNYKRKQKSNICKGRRKNRRIKWM